MREILFKAKQINNGEWVQGYYTHVPYLGKHYIVHETKIQCGINTWQTMNSCEINPETLCQYTGMTDKNGKKIWENDILKYSYDYENSPWLISGKEIKYYIGAVFWQEWRGTWSVCSKGKNRGCNQDIYVYSRNPNRTEVIGNIFDNPELLEGGASNE